MCYTVGRRLDLAYPDASRQPLGFLGENQGWAQPCDASGCVDCVDDMVTSATRANHSHVPLSLHAQNTGGLASRTHVGLDVGDAAHLITVSIFHTLG